jgi:GNAT superfamily N-acetyltransferase
MQPAIIIDTDPLSPQAQAALRAYTLEVAADAGLEALDVDTALADVDGFWPPTGAFLVAIRGDAVVGCAGLRALSTTDGEVKRMWVAPDDRGFGLGSRLLLAVEQQARSRGFTRLLLDTHRALTPAIAFYTAHGYEQVPRYNDNPDATHFFAKRLG